METWQDEVTHALGEAAGRSGVMGEMAGKIFGALYLTDGALSLDDICERVGASKGTVSVQVRDLLALGMVRKVWVRGSRRDHYEATTDLWAIAGQVIARRLEQETQSLLAVIEAQRAAIGTPRRGTPEAAVRARVDELASFLRVAGAMLEGIRRGGFGALRPAE